MRIKDIQKMSPELQINMPADEKKTSERPGLEFKRQLSTMKNADYEAYIRDLTQKINAQGEIVAKKIDIKEIQKYREMITELINETVSNSYVFNKANQFDAKGRHKVFAMIRNVNRKLDDLTAEVLKEQSDNIKVLEIVDEVRGLLVDLFL